MLEQGSFISISRIVEEFAISKLIRVKKILIQQFGLWTLRNILELLRWNWRQNKRQIELDFELLRFLIEAIFVMLIKINQDDSN